MKRLHCVNGIPNNNSLEMHFQHEYHLTVYVLRKMPVDSVAQKYVKVIIQNQVSQLSFHTPFAPSQRNPTRRDSDYHLRSGCPRIGLWDEGKLLGFCLSFSVSQIPLDPPPPSRIPDSLHHLLQPWGLTGRAGACGRTCWVLAACSVC